MVTSIPMIVQPCIIELLTLFESPTYTILSPSSLPLCSSIVIISAIIWHGCRKSDRPLITGTVACSANSLTSLWPNTLAIITSQYLLRTWAVSPMVSPRPSWVPLGCRYSAWPPSWVIPTSNDTLVLVDDFMKIIAKDLPLRSSWGSPRFCFLFKSCAVSKIVLSS